MEKKVSEKLDQIFSDFPNTDAPKDAMAAFNRRYKSKKKHNEIPLSDPERLS